jgi:SAM-dependent methyltransferase
VAVVLEHPEGRALVEDLGAGRRRVTVEPSRESTFVSRYSCDTSYPPELIQRILGSKGVGYLCDEIARDEDPRYVERMLRHAMLSYVPREYFAGKRLLDFGSGSGASTAVLARLFPATEIIAVELISELVEIAQLRARFHGLSNIEFHISPSGQTLPENLGQFDVVTLSAVYEHLLPAERRVLLPLIWSRLRSGGILFLNQTPHRWYPLEYHTSGLPLLNYLPDQVAFRAARRFSRRIDPTSSWPDLLRAGIRGGTEHGILSELAGDEDSKPVLLAPSGPGVRDKVDMWYRGSMEGPRPMRIKGLVRIAFKAVSRVTGEDFTPSLDLAIQKT